MTTALANQLSTRMKARKYSSYTLEKEAGLTNHSVLNILRGRTKRPSAEVLHAIANTLGCTVSDLLENKEIFEVDDSSKSKTDLLDGPYENADLLQEAFEVVNAKIKQAKLQLTLQQVLTCIEEVYLYSLQKKLDKVDEPFTEWFLEMLGR